MNEKIESDKPVSNETAVAKNVTAVATHLTSNSPLKSNLTSDLSTISMRESCKYAIVPDLVELFSGSTELRQYIEKYGHENSETSILPKFGTDRQEIVKIVAEDMRSDLKNHQMDELKPPGYHLSNAAKAIIDTFPFFKIIYSGPENDHIQPEEAFYFVDRQKNHKPSGFLYRKFENWRRTAAKNTKNQQKKRENEEPETSTGKKRQKKKDTNLSNDLPKVNFMDVPVEVSGVAV